MGKRGVYTRARGLDRETNKALLLRYIEANSDDGSIYQDFQQVLPSLTRHQIQNLLQELKRTGKIKVGGKRSLSRNTTGGLNADQGSPNKVLFHQVLL